LVSRMRRLYTDNDVLASAPALTMSKGYISTVKGGKYGLIRQTQTKISLHLREFTDVLFRYVYSPMFNVIRRSLPRHSWFLVMVSIIEEYILSSVFPLLQKFVDDY
jgi:hypothetical protein